MSRAWLFVVFTLAATVSGQLLLKWAVTRRGVGPHSASDMIHYVFGSLLDPLVILSLCLAFAAALSWIAAVSRLPLSAAYPFQSLTLVFTVLGTVLLFGESVSTSRWVGVAAVTFGLLLVGRG